LLPESDGQTAVSEPSQPRRSWFEVGKNPMSAIRKQKRLGLARK
jgi:hypothetical protein